VASGIRHQASGISKNNDPEAKGLT